jgi:ubiquinone/menaquinone biosynthesis C-methylase UbiE
MIEEWESPPLLFRMCDALSNSRIFSFIYSGFIRTIGLSGGETVLDFGSGSGTGSKYLAEILAKGGGSLTCVDTSHYLMNIAKKRMAKYGNVRFFNAPIQEIGLSADSFDVICMHYVLHEVTPKLRSGIVKEFYRMAKPSGRVCLQEPQREYDGMPISEIRDLMSEAGFREVSAKEKGNVFTGVYQKVR